VSSHETYHFNCEIHRNNKPASIIYLYGEVALEEYYNHGSNHRENGPACINYNENGEIIKKEYYINGILYNIK
jgi:antitoxin component YwqK of YwqJK toxin-antitoxin module